MKPTVYIETTIAGHLTSRLPTDPLVAGQMLATREWWKESRQHFETFTSEVVLDEASRGDPQAAAERLEALATTPLVPVTEAARELARLLVSQNALPLKARVDAAHAAIAATIASHICSRGIAGTWQMRRCARIEQVCRERGYKPPIICTPYELNEVQL